MKTIDVDAPLLSRRDAGLVWDLFFILEKMYVLSDDELLTSKSYYDFILKREKFYIMNAFRRKHG